jgi:hypothetical protein
MDALLRVHPDGLGGGVEVRFLYNGELIYGRRWPTRALAQAEAVDKLKELHARGWVDPAVEFQGPNIVDYHSHRLLRPNALSFAGSFSQLEGRNYVI